MGLMSMTEAEIRKQLRKLGTASALVEKRDALYKAAAEAGMTQAEIASETGSTPGAVYQAFRKIRQHA